MDKAGGNAAAEYVRSLSDGDPVFFSSASMAARDAMKEDVKKEKNSEREKSSIGKEIGKHFV